LSPLTTAPDFEYAITSCRSWYAPLGGHIGRGDGGGDGGGTDGGGAEGGGDDGGGSGGADGGGDEGGGDMAGQHQPHVAGQLVATFSSFSQKFQSDSHK